MNVNFKAALKKVLTHEGGWSDNPKDPGGATMKGVTLATYREYSKSEKSKDELRNISDQELEDIYRSGYWNKCQCDKLPSGIDYAVFDAAVNSGPRRSVKWLQAAVDADPDGAMGPNTHNKVKAHTPIKVTQDMCDNRLSFLQSLKTWETFGKGWARRVEEVRTTAREMAGGTTEIKADNEEIIIPIKTEYKLVRKGSRGTLVAQIQAALGIDADGIFGSGTKSAVATWQKSHGLDADGIVGRDTYRSLGIID